MIQLKARRAIAGAIGAGVAASSVVSLSLWAHAEPVSPGAPTGSSHLVACAGSEATVTTSGGTATVNCAFGATQVGQTAIYQTWRKGTTTTARTALPSGVKAGSLLVTTVAAPAGATVTMPGWAKAFDTASGAKGVRLTAWYRTAGAAEQAPTATISTAGAVSMMTTAFRGASASSPVAGAAAVGTKATVPGATTAGGSAVAVAAAVGTRVGVTPADATSGAVLVRSGRTVRTAQVVVPVKVGQPASFSWTVTGSSGSVAGLVSVKAAPAAAVPAGAVAVAPGGSTQVSCGAEKVSWTATSATVVRIDCGTPGAPVSVLPTASPTGPSTSASPSASVSASPSASSPSASASASPGVAQVNVPAGPGTPRPTTPPAPICDNSTYLTGPATAPAGAVTVPAGDNSKLTDTTLRQANTTFWFAPGVHTFGSGAYGQIEAGSNSTYLGAPGAIIDGQHQNQYAFTQRGSKVTIKYLTIRNFGAAGDNNNEGVVNHDRGDGWVVSNNTIIGNAGAGVMLGANSKTTYNCLKNNGQYGFSSFAAMDTKTNSNLLLDHNEIVGNNTDNWESRQPGCGCTGGGKFWETNVAVVSNNYVHGNHGPGLWADTNNRGFLIENNWISDNDSNGVFYEISFNFVIRNNVFLKNSIVTGKARSDNWSEGAIYLSEAGGEPKAGSLYSQSEISGNYFKDNFNGVILWENSDRYCRPAEENSDSSATCPFFDRTQGARFKTQNIAIKNNDFLFSKATVGCSDCGKQVLLANYGTYPMYKGTVTQTAVVYNQHNVFSNNTYTGDWRFMVWDWATVLPFSKWQAAPYKQDAGSTLG